MERAIEHAHSRGGHEPVDRVASELCINSTYEYVSMYLMVAVVARTGLPLNVGSGQPLYYILSSTTTLNLSANPRYPPPTTYTTTTPAESRCRQPH